MQRDRIKIEDRVHYVYHLFVGDELIYVGRSLDPKRRKGKFERRHNTSTSMKTFECVTFKNAQDRERADIRKYCPKFNKHVVSSSGTLGQSITRRTRLKISNSLKNNIPWNKGKPSKRKGKSNYWLIGRRPWNKGRPWSARMRLRFSKSHFGKHASTATRQKMSKSQLRRWEQVHAS